MMFEYGDLLAGASEPFERCLHGTPGGIVGMDDTAMAVAAFTVEMIGIARLGVTFVSACERHAALDQPLNGFARMRHGMPDCGFIAQAGAGGECIGDMCLDAVACIEHGRDAALGI